MRLNLNRTQKLLILGVAGCGKSVLASSVIDTLTSLRSEDAPVVYYYCDYADKESLQPAFILGTLIRGLLFQSDSIPKEIGDLIDKYYYDGERTPETNEVLGILMKVMELFEQVVLVLDGIDEVDEMNFYSVLALLKTLVSHPLVIVKIFITSREHKDLLSVLSSGIGAGFHIHLDQFFISNDIDSYIRCSVDSLMASKRSIIDNSDTDMKKEIIQRLREGAKGM